MTISSIPSSLATQLTPNQTTSSTATTGSQAAPKYTPAEVVENFAAQVESNAITEILGGGSDSGSTGLAGLLSGPLSSGSTGDLASLIAEGAGTTGSTMGSTTGLASLLGGSGTSTSATDLASLLGGSNASTSTSDLTSLASIASSYDLARSAAALGVNPFDQSATQAAGSTVDATA
jgi:hypothetical protein